MTTFRVGPHGLCPVEDDTREALDLLLDVLACIRMEDDTGSCRGARYETRQPKPEYL